MTTTRIESASGTERTLEIRRNEGGKWVYLVVRDQDQIRGNINVKPEELAAAINDLPGFTATYEEPKPAQKTLGELPEGTVFQFDVNNEGYRSHIAVYEVAKAGYLYSRMTRTYNPIGGDAKRKVTVINEGGEL